jgi:hypothetical protein
MGLRVAEKTLRQFMKALQPVLPHYLEYDIDHHAIENWDPSFFFGYWVYHITFTDFKYETPKLDVKEIQVQFTEFSGTPMIKVDFPAIESWKIEAMSHANTWILPS